MSCRVVADVDMATRTCRRRVKKTTRRANTSDKTTTLSAENALKYIDFNTKRVINTPCGRAERLTKRTCFRAEITSFTVQKRENWMPKWQRVAQTCCARQRFYVVNADEMSCRRRRRDGGDDTSRTLRRRRHVVVVSRRTTRHAVTTDKTILCSQKLSISLFC